MREFIPWGGFRSPLRDLLMLKAASGGGLTEYTATGNPVSFETNVAKDLTGCTVAFSPVQAGSGDPSPSNVRPISGWTGVTLYHSGADTSDPTTYQITFPALGKNLFNKNDVTIGCCWYRGTIRGNYTGQNASALISIKPGTTYTLKRDASVAYAEYFDAEKEYFYEQYYQGKNGVTFTTPNNAYYIAFTVNDETIDTAQLEEGSSSTTYEPYNNTVYGGTVDLVSGVLTVTMASLKISEVITSYQTNWGGRFRGGLRKAGTAETFDASILCSIYKSVNSGNNVDNAIIGYGSGTGGVCYIKDSAYTDYDSFIAARGDVPIYFPLYVPRVYQLTPQQIKTLIGTNTVWSDANGENTIKYLKKG